jgi:hypothetical protein
MCARASARASARPLERQLMCESINSCAEASARAPNHLRCRDVGLLCPSQDFGPLSISAQPSCRPEPLDRCVWSVPNAVGVQSVRDLVVTS